MNSIFNQNLNTSTNRNLFNSGSHPPVNPFASNQTQNLNQNIQNQPIVIPNQPNLPANNHIPSNPRVQDSLLEKYSFATILQKITSKQKLTKSEKDFVTTLGLVMFEKDDWKTNFFTNTKSKQGHLGFGPDVLLHKGQIPKCQEINKIWIKIVKHFAHICQTNQMNGYFLLRKILSEEKYYEGLYRPKPGLGNKVFEPNLEKIRLFYTTQINGKPSVNIKGKVYMQIMGKMVDAYTLEFLSFLEIIQKVGVTVDNGLLEQGSSKNLQVNSRTIQPAQHQPGTSLHKLVFGDLLDHNIMTQLWQMFQRFALSKLPQPAPQEIKEDKAKQKWIQMKKALFKKVNEIITSLLQVQFTQQMLMENQPIPLLQVIKFVTEDIEKVQISNLIEPRMQNIYIDSGLNLILAAFPFAAYILDDSLITSYFNFPSQKNKFINARQLKNRQDILNQLVKVKVIEFEPLVIWAKLQLKRIQTKNVTQPKNLPLQKQKQKERRQQAIQTWQNYLKKETANFDIFEDDKWKYWVGLFLENISIEAIIQNTTLRSHILYYCKRALKGRQAEFFRLWDGILRFEYSQQCRDMESTLKYLQKNPTEEEKRKPIYVLPPRILRNFELYTTGRFLKEINDSDYLAEALNVFTTLIKRRKAEQANINYTKKLLFFLQNGLELPQEPFASQLFDIIVGTLSAGFGISCKKKNAQNQVFDYLQMREMEFMIDGQSLQYQVKFFCELIIQNMHQLQILQSYLFDSRDHLEITNDVPGIRTCIFLCKILQKIPTFTTNNIKCMRYLIRAIDCLFTFQQTQQLILCALSVVFPYDSGRKNQIAIMNRTTEKYFQEKSTRRCMWNIIEFLEEQRISNTQSLKQVQKLRRTISYHFNHMIKFCDSVDEYFTINKEYDQPELYQVIESQTNNWKFTDVSTFLKNHRRRFRATDWFYTIARVMQSSHLLPIDIDSMIESIRKMRIPNDGSYVSFEPMKIILKIINRGSVTDQMLKFLKPIGSQHKLTEMIENEKMACYKPSQIQLQEPNGTRYSKYQNKTVVEYKSARLVMDEQSQIIRTICLYTRLIEQILRLRLDSRGFDSYSLICSLNLVEQMLPKLIIHEQIHHFRAVSHVQQESGTQMNIIASLVALLNLYHYRCKFPAKMPWMKRGFAPLLEFVEMGSKNNMAVEEKWDEKKFTLNILDQNTDFYVIYEKDFKYLNQKYFQSLLYEMTDFSFENDDTSLRSTVLSILQLLFENNCGKIVVQALSNYSYPIKCTGNLSDYSLTSKYLQSENHKNLTPLLFSHVNTLLNLLNFNSSIHTWYHLPQIVRAIQALSVFVAEPFLAQEIIASLPNIRRCLVKLITSDEIYSDKNCSKAQQINILNRISLFALRILQKTKTILPEEEFENKIIDNFLINPENFLKMLFERMTQLYKDFKIDNSIFIQTATDHLANYLMQINLTRNALYRATYDVLIKLVFSVMQFLRKDQIAELLYHLLFKNHPLITKKPKELKFEPEIIMKLQLEPYEIIQIVEPQDQTLLTTILSQRITDFAHCNRMNFRKYGPNFLYDANLAFHLLKAQFLEEMQNAEQAKLRVRKHVFMIQLVNCFKSLYFSYQSMVKSYFQLMFLLTNTGPIGQNLSINRLDKNIPKIYEQAILQNKYCLKNQFSFVQSIHLLKNITLMGNEESIVIKIAMILQEFLTSVQFQPQNYEVLLTEINERESIVRGIPKNAIFIDRVFLQTRVGNCLNPSHVVKVLRNISNALMEHFHSQIDIKSTAQRYTKFLQYFLHIITKFPFTLSIVLQSLSSILSQYNRIIQVLTLTIRQRTFDKDAYHHRIQSIENNNKIQEDWLTQKRIDELKVKEMVITTCSGLLYKFYECQKHSNLFGTGFKERPISQQNSNIQSYIKKSELEKNIDLICSIASQVYIEPSTGGLFSMSLQSQLQRQIHSSVHYIIKLLMENLGSYDTTMTKVSIFSLCNKFYMINEQHLVTQWQFHSNQFQRCKEILLRKSIKSETMGQNLQRMIALDSLCTFSLANKNSIFHADILPILMQIIHFDNNAVLQQQHDQEHDPADKNSIPNRYYPQKTKRYNLSERASGDMTIEKVIEYKKLLITLLVTMPPGSWTDQVFSVEANALYLEILKFQAVDLSTSKLHPSRAVEEKLNQLIVTEEGPNFLQKKIPKYLQNILPNMPISSQKNQTNNLLIKSSQFSAPTPQRVNQTLSTSSASKISLFDFISFINHSELVHTYLLIIKNGIHASKIFESTGGFFFEPTQYAQIWDSIEQKILSLYEYYSGWADTLLDNPRMISNLTYLYNYVCQDPSYLVQFNSLSLFFDPIDVNYPRDHLVRSIVEYCTVIAELMPVIRDIKWKAAVDRKEQRIICLNKCSRLLQKNKIVNAFRELNLYDQLYHSLKEDLINQIKEEQSPKNKNRSITRATNY